MTPETKDLLIEMARVWTQGMDPPYDADAGTFEAPDFLERNIFAGHVRAWSDGEGTTYITVASSPDAEGYIVGSVPDEVLPDA